MYLKSIRSPSSFYNYLPNGEHLKISPPLDSFTLWVTSDFSNILISNTNSKHLGERLHFLQSKINPHIKVIPDFAPTASPPFLIVYLYMKHFYTNYYVSGTILNALPRPIL